MEQSYAKSASVTKVTTIAQQAIRAKKDQWRATRSSSSEGSSVSDSAPIVTIHSMSSSKECNVERTTNGFKESLRFFQSQVNNGIVQGSNHCSSIKAKSTHLNSNSNRLDNGSIGGVHNKTSAKTNVVPSVDNILNSVRNIRITQSNKNTDVNSKQSLIQCNGSQSVRSSSMHTRVTPIVTQPASSKINELQIKLDLKAPSVNNNDAHSMDAAKQRPLSNGAGKPSLSSNFNPTFDLVNGNNSVNASVKSPVFQEYRKHASNPKSMLSENKEQHSINNTINFTQNQKNNTSSSHNLSNLVTQNGSLDKVERKENCSTQRMDTNSNINPLKTDFPQKTESRSEVPPTVKPCFTNVVNKESSVKNNDKCSVKIISHSHLNEDTQLPETNSTDREVCKSDCYLNNNKDVSSKQESVGNSLEKPSDSFESDYDSQDFVVHKTSFSEDYLDVMSEDAFSSLNEDYEVEYPDDKPGIPDIPSPDYASDEDEEFHVHQGVATKYEDDCEDDFIDNSSLYVADPRRYVYYPEDKELEVIPEEDEDDLEEEEDLYSQDDSDPDQVSDYCLPVTSSNDSKLISQTECDSGVTDDQRSNSSAGEEYYIEDDTDSAKGSLLLDSCRESPVYPENCPLIVTSMCSKAKKRLEEDVIKPKWCTQSWNPTKLLEVLYRLDPESHIIFEKNERFSTKKGTVELHFKGSKRPRVEDPFRFRYVKVSNGTIACYENCNSEEPLSELNINGGTCDVFDERMLKVQDCGGNYIVLRFLCKQERDEWEWAISYQITAESLREHNLRASYPMATHGDVIIIDIGGYSVRAGVLMSSPTLPDMYFPTICATSKKSKKRYFGTEALLPEMRKNCVLSYPFLLSETSQDTFDCNVLYDLLRYIFQKLNVEPQNFKIQLCVNQILTLEAKVQIAKILLYHFKVKRLNVTHQTVSSLHAYDSKTGVIVDIGERLDIKPIVDGYAIESGASTSRYGGNRMIHHMKQALMENNINLYSVVETYLAHHVLEQLCYIPENYYFERRRCHANHKDVQMTIPIKQFFDDKCPWTEVILDMGRFQVPEGIFRPKLWGLDIQGVHELVYKAIQECSIDSRKKVAQHIYLSGGLTLLPGFINRLQTEISSLMPTAIAPKVHASQYRCHMSYIGGCKIADMDDFDAFSLDVEECEVLGVACVEKWISL